MFDTFSHARQHAAQMREYYEAYVVAGFSPDEALQFVLILLRGMAQHDH